MDPLSMTASIIALIQLTTALTSYLVDVQHATSDQRKVAVETSLLSSLLTSLRYRLEVVSVDDAWFNQIKLLGMKNGPLEQFRDVLEEMAGQIDKTNSQRTRDIVKSALMWRFTRTNVEVLLQRMERLKSFIQIALSNDAFTLSQAIHERVGDMASEVRQLHLDVQQLHVSSDDEAMERMARWLRIPDPYTSYHVAIKKRHPGTGSWLLCSQIFQDWKTSSSSSLLWLHGKAGCGKTILSAIALENILDQTAGQPKSVVAIFYFDFDDATKRSASNATRSLLLQIARQTPGGMKVLQELYHRCDKGGRQPTDDQARSLLYALMGQTQQKFIILDALDECRDRDELLNVLEEVAGSPQYKVCMLVTSRLERDIEVSLGPIAHQSIHVQNAAIYRDIIAFIRGQLETNRKLRKWPAQVHEEIAQRLGLQADGMFRWVYCQLESLQQCVQLRDLRKALSTLPRTLDETYTRIIEDIESRNHLQNAISVLQWLCFAERPLNLPELVDVLAIRNEEDGDFDVEQRMPDPEDIVTVCSSLISRYTTLFDRDISKSRAHKRTLGLVSPNHTTGDKNTSSYETVWIRLAHFSVKEYLLSDRCPFQDELQSQFCHLSISESCIRYLMHICREPTLTDGVIDSYPLAQYAAQSWWRHAQKVRGGFNARYLDLMYEFFTNRDNLLTWIRLYDIDDDEAGQDLSRNADCLSSPLYYTARIGLLEVTEKLIQHEINAGAQSGFADDALWAASAEGYADIVRVLLEAGADIDTRNDNLISALEVSSARGHMDVVLALLDGGVDVNHRGDIPSDHLDEARKRFHANIKWVLSAEEASYSAQSGFHADALSAAAAEGHIDVVRTLLSASANVNTQLGFYGNALCAASISGHIDVVRVLLDAGADVNTQAGFYNNALCAAVDEGHTDVAQLLLDVGANVNSVDIRGDSALCVALKGGHLDLAKMLLNAGADANIQGGFHGNALCMASASGHIDLVLALLDAGADSNAQGGHHAGSALYLALTGGYMGVFQALVDQSGDVNQPDYLGNTALHYLCHTQSSWHIIITLVQKGGDPNLLDSFGRSCFDWVASNSQLLRELKQLGHIQRPVPATTRLAHLRRSIVQLLGGPISDTMLRTLNLSRLGRSLLFLSEKDDALFAFGLQVQAGNDDTPYFEVICDLCDERGTTGTRYVCMQCADVDICDQCIALYKLREHLPLCRGHDFLEVPPVASDEEFSRNRRLMTEKIRVWLQNIQDRMSRSISSDQEGLDVKLPGI